MELVKKYSFNLILMVLTVFLILSIDLLPYTAWFDFSKFLIFLIGFNFLLFIGLGITDELDGV